MAFCFKNLLGERKETVTTAVKWEKKIPVTERFGRVGLRREQRGKSGRDEQQLSDILFVHPTLPFALQFIHCASQG